MPVKLLSARHDDGRIHAVGVVVHPLGHQAVVHVLVRRSSQRSLDLSRDQSVSTREELITYDGHPATV